VKEDLETLLQHMLTNYKKAAMISYIAAHTGHFEEMIELALFDKQPCSWRAAWLLWSCMEVNNRREQGYIKRLIDSIPSKNDNQQRELFIILQKMELGYLSYPDNKSHLSRNGTYM